MKKKKRQKRVKRSKFPHTEIVYWSSLLVILVCNLLISLALIPFILFFSDQSMLLIIISLALTLGSIFTFFIHHIQSLELHHHIFGALILTVVAVLNVSLMASLSNSLNTVLQLHQEINPFSLGFLYGLFFLFPYCVYHGYRYLKSK